MAKVRIKKPEDVPDGAPEWMVTFSDCMTLLLTFFVLLLSFAKFDPTTLPDLGVSFANAMSSVGHMDSLQKDSMWQRQEVDSHEVVAEGSETRTDVTTYSTNFIRERRPLDFRNLKVFTIPSDEMFWGKRAALSTQGRELLDIFAIFLRAQPNRVVVREIVPGSIDNSSVQRAWAVVEYLSSTDGVNKELFSISMSTSSSKSHQRQRMLEITLLERDIY